MASASKIQKKTQNISRERQREREKRIKNKFGISVFGGHHFNVCFNTMHHILLDDKSHENSIKKNTFL